MLGALVATVLAGCSSSADDDQASPSSTSSADTSLSATMTQSRVNEGTRTINAELTNTSDEPVTVQSIALDSNRFAPLAPAEKGSVFAPDQTIDLAIEYGEPTCDGDLTQASYTATLSDGSTVELSIDRDGMAWLDRLYSKECALRTIGGIASIEYGPHFVRDTVGGQQVLTGELVLRRPAGSDDSVPLTVRSLGGSVLVRLEGNPAGTLPATLEPGAQELRIPILFGSFRCDQHARAGSSQTFLLSVFVKTAALPQTRVIKVPDKHVQGQIFDLIADVCGDTDF